MYDYVAGKADWSASGLPREGRLAATPVAQDALREVPTCALDERVGDIRRRLEAGGGNTCVVVNRDGVVLGRLTEDALQADLEATAESVMEAGPTTFRPDFPLDGLVER
ncbi:MAG: CBS domain-containing protein, partial [Chloroflexi bacterium]|nr:CBS domain-containing protein [Chloroflexota bacterium]